MAGAHKRTTCGLAIVAVVFIVVIIILCVVPDPCRRSDPRPECRAQFKSYYDEHVGGTTETSSSSTTVTPVTTPVSTTKGLTTPSDKTTPQPTSTKETTIVLTPIPTSSTSTTVSSSTASTSSSSSSPTSTSTTDRTTSTSSSTAASESTTTPRVLGEESSSTTTWLERTTSPTIETTSIIEDTGETTIRSDANTTQVATTSAETTSTTTFIDNEITTDMTEQETTLLVTDTTVEATTSPETTSTTTFTDTTSPETTSTTTFTDTTSPETTGTITFTDTEITTDMTETETTLLATSPETTSTEPEITTDMTEISTTVHDTSEVTTDIPATTTLVLPDRDDNLCDTPICREVARRMLDIMDPKDVDPCEDFYQFSCGGILDDPFLKPEDPLLPTHILIKEALVTADRADLELKELLVVYDSCINYTTGYTKDERLQYASKVVSDLGYQFNPRIKEKYKDDFPEFTDKFDLTIALAKMMKMNFAPFFDITIDVDDEDRELFQLKMNLPTMESAFSKELAKDVCFSQYKFRAENARRAGEVFDVNSNYTDYIKCKDLGDGLKARLTKAKDAVVALNLAGFLENPEIENETIVDAKMNLDYMLVAFAEVMPSPPERRKTERSKIYEIFTIEQLDDGTAFTDSPISFSAFFKELLGKDIDPNMKIQVYFRKVFDEMLKIMFSYYEDQEPSMQNAMLMLWTERVYGDIVEPLGHALGSQDYCFNVVTKMMDDYISYLYVKESPNWDVIKNQMDRMIQLSMRVAKTQLEEVETRVDLLDKLTDMTGEIASRDGVKTSLLKDRTEVISVNENFGENYASLMQYYRRRLYNISYERPVYHRAMWSVFQVPYATSGMTSYRLNKFLIPQAAMSPPLYYQGVPSYINYAGIGHMIAHELMHGFDSTGMKYNGYDKVNLRSDANLISSSECLGEQLQTTKIMNSSSGFAAMFTMYNKLGLDELMADSAAAGLAWDTYQQELMNQRQPPDTTTTTHQPLPRNDGHRNKRRTSGNLYAIEGLRNLAKRSVSPEDHQHQPFGNDLLLDDIQLPHLTNYNPLQLFYIKMAQNQCSKSSEVNILSVMEKEHLPPKLRVNMMLGNDPMFMKAFKCPTSSKWTPDGPCPYRPTGVRSNKALAPPTS